VRNNFLAWFPLHDPSKPSEFSSFVKPPRPEQRVFPLQPVSPSARAEGLLHVPKVAHIRIVVEFQAKASIVQPL
jgi:hypothetical protein